MHAKEVQAEMSLMMLIMEFEEEKVMREKMMAVPEWREKKTLMEWACKEWVRPHG